MSRRSGRKKKQQQELLTITSVNNANVGRSTGEDVDIILHKDVKGTVHIQYSAPTETRPGIITYENRYIIYFEPRLNNLSKNDTIIRSNGMKLHIILVDEKSDVQVVHCLDFRNNIGK